MISSWVIARLPSGPRCNRFLNSLLMLLWGCSLLILRAEAVSLRGGARLSAPFARGREDVDEEPFPVCGTVSSEDCTQKIQDRARAVPRTGSSSKAEFAPPQQLGYF